MRVITLALLVFVTVSCDERTPAGPSNNGISGLVIDFATGVGVSHASVVFGEVTAIADATGRYRIASLATGPYEPRVDGVPVGQSLVTGADYRGDLLVRPGTCVTRYGTLSDAFTHRPVADATVAIFGPGLNVPTVSGPDGWYRIDLGCPANGLVGFNTTELRVSHPNYLDTFRPVGRGVGGVTRFDLSLQRR